MIDVYVLSEDSTTLRSLNLSRPNLAVGGTVPVDPSGITLQSVTANGSDGNVATNATDGNLATRWSHNANPSILTLVLTNVAAVGGVAVHHYNGASGDAATFDIETSADGSTWIKRYLGRSSGALDGPEAFRFPAVSTRYVRYVGYGRDTSSWNSVVEIAVLAPDAGSHSPASPDATATPGDALVTLGGIAKRPTPVPTSWRWSTGTSSPPTTILVSGLTTPAYTHQPLTNGVARFYRLEAVNVAGAALSTILSATPTGASAPGSEILHGMDLTLADVGNLAGVTRTNSGRVTSSSAGQLIQNLNIQGTGNDDGCVYVQHNNVTIRNCRMLTGSGPQSGVKVANGVVGTIIEHCFIDGQKPIYSGNFGNGGVEAYGKQFEVRRCHIINTRVAIQGGWGGTEGSIIEENWVGEIWNNTAGTGGSNSSGGISWRGGPLASPPATYIRRNRVECAAMALIYGYPDGDPCRNFWMIDNYLIGTQSTQRKCGYGLRGGYVTYMSDYAGNQDIKIEGNRFAGVFAFGTNGAVNISQPGNTFTNNRWVGSSTDVAPKLAL